MSSQAPGAVPRMAIAPMLSVRRGALAVNSIAPRLAPACCFVWRGKVDLLSQSFPQAEQTSGWLMNRLNIPISARRLSGEARHGW